jgi:hypothetical protein
MLQLFPASNNSKYQVSFGLPAQLTSDDQGVARVDHSLSDRQRLSFRYFVFHYNRPPYIDPNLLYGWDGQWGYSQALAVNHTFTISPRWLHNMTFSYAFMAPIRQQATTPDVRLSAFGVRAMESPLANQLVVNISGWTGPNFSSPLSRSAGPCITPRAPATPLAAITCASGGETRRYKTAAKALRMLAERPVLPGSS